MAKNVRDERRRRRLAVRTGDRNERSLGCAQSTLAGEDFNVADDLDTALARLDDCPMRLGMRERHPRRQHQCGKSRPVDRREIDERDTLSSCRLTARRAVIPRCDVGAAFEQRARRGGPGAPRPNTATVLP